MLGPGPGRSTVNRDSEQEGRAMGSAKPLAVAGAALALLTACTSAASQPSTVQQSPIALRSPSAEPTPAAFIADLAVDGARTLHIMCVGPAGTGRPTVVFENGAGPDLSTWSAQMEDVRATHRACAY